MEAQAADNILVSVIIPCYNTAAYLDDCLESVCSQNHGNLEIILIDDGSTDGSGEMCDAWALRDSRIRVLHRDHEGPSSRNVGIEAFQGQYCVFVDSDDVVAPGYVGDMLQVALRDEVDVVVCGYDRVSDTGEYLSTRALGLSGRRDMQAFCELVLVDVLYPSVWGKLYARDFLKAVRLGNEPVGEDVSLWTRVVELGIMQSCSVVDAPLYGYRSRTGSLMRSFNVERELSGVAAWDGLCAAIANRFEACSSAASFRMVKSRVEAIDRAIEAGADLEVFSAYFATMRGNAKGYLAHKGASPKRRFMTATLMASPALYRWALKRVRG